MAKLCFLRMQVTVIVLIRFHLNRHPLHNLESIAFQALEFCGDCSSAAAFGERRDLSKFVRRCRNRARSGANAKLNIRIDRIQSLLLQLISFQFVDQADAPAFLAHIEQHAAAASSICLSAASS